MNRNSMMDEFVRDLSHGYGGCSTPEGILDAYKTTKSNLKRVRLRLKNPVNLNGGSPLKPSTIRQMETEEANLVKQVDHYRKFIKKLFQYNLLPTNKLISGKDRSQFVFSLWTMLELPEFGKAVYYANRLICDRGRTLPTNEDYRQWLSHPGLMPRKKEEQSRENMYDALVDSLRLTIEHVQRDRQRLIFSDTQYQHYHPPKAEKEVPFENSQAAVISERTEKQTSPIDDSRSKSSKDHLADRLESTGNIAASLMAVNQKMDSDLSKMSNDLNAMAERMMPICKSKLIPGEAHTFINLRTLCQKIEPAIEKLHLHVSWVARLYPLISSSELAQQEKVREALAAMAKDQRKVIEATEEIINSINFFKKQKQQKPKIDNTSAKGQSTINHVKVFKGGLYKPTAIKTYMADDLISDEFKAWQVREKAKKEMSQKDHDEKD